MFCIGTKLFYTDINKVFEDIPLRLLVHNFVTERMLSREEDTVFQYMNPLYRPMDVEFWHDIYCDAMYPCQI